MDPGASPLRCGQAPGRLLPPHEKDAWEGGPGCQSGCTVGRALLINSQKWNYWVTGCAHFQAHGACSQMTPQKGHARLYCHPQSAQHRVSRIYFKVGLDKACEKSPCCFIPTTWHSGKDETREAGKGPGVGGGADRRSAGGV